ncbi:lateral signaling target protein 2 homolog isoform X2 [Rhipicephalus sanguineus]|uniref:lateral signaling target protein 2 homolog isoform X2 n=1 Tax=Rhipicephalus sanguineus TaxID=34632 RepID=UPI0018957436|nr:lateral signaling target protein 2 homolog isoform X2 [Rhipicephalus sanguineus]
MNSLRKWFYRPKKEDNSALAQFYWADQELNLVATELDSFDGRKDPDRCSALINQLRVCQDRVLGICHDIMDEAIPDARANRDFRAKFPDDVLQENMSGLLWFGAECLAAGSNIMNREQESSQMRPLARALTRSLDNVRCLLREQCLRNPHEYPEKLKESLKTFDRLFAEFELSYVSAMVPVKSAKEYHLQQEVVVLFSETLQRAIEVKLVPQEMVETYDPALMFTIPRLAIVAGLVLFSDGPLNVDNDSSSLSELFRPFYSLLCKIRELLWTLSREELWLLEKTLCQLEEPKACVTSKQCSFGTDEYIGLDSSVCVKHFYSSYNGCKQFIKDFYNHNFGVTPESEPVQQMQKHIRELGLETKEFWAVKHSSPLARKVVAASQCPSQNATSPHKQQPNAVDSESNASYDSDDSVVSENWWPLFSEPLQAGASAGASTEQQQPRQSPCLRRSSKTSSASDRVPVVPQIRRLQNEERSLPSPCSSCKSLSSLSSAEWECMSYQSTDTSSYNSDYPDDEEIALALQAAEIAFHNELRCRFKSTDDLIHRLFVGISGVADQLQTNFAGEMRNILKCVFEMNSSSKQDSSAISLDTESPMERSSVPERPLFSLSFVDAVEFEEEGEQRGSSGRHSVDSAEEVLPDELSLELSSESGHRGSPVWMPDEFTSNCMDCNAHFTLLRRRHHCRRCGKIFCSRCSAHSITLPRYGHYKPVRVCNSCFICRVTSVVEEMAHGC